MRREVELLTARFNRLVRPWERKPVRLNHYSSSDKVTKILRSRIFRLYNVFDMKDKEEFEYPRRAIWTELQPYYGELVLEMSDLFNPVRRVRLAAFAACFCEAQESEFMWRRYGDRFRGASLTIHGRQFAATPNPHAVYPMVYNRAEFRRILAQFFQWTVSRDWIARFNLADARSLAIEACLLLTHFLVRMKRKWFSPEREWRALVLGSRPFKTDDDGRRFIEIELRPEYLAGVTLGSRSPLREKEVSELLGAGFHNIPVRRSKLR